MMNPTNRLIGLLVTVCLPWMAGCREKSPPPPPKAQAPSHASGSIAKSDETASNALPDAKALVVRFWTAVADPKNDCCTPLGELRSADEKALRALRYDRVLLSDTDMALSGRRIPVTTATLRRFDAALTSCETLKDGENLRQTLARLDALYAAMMLTVHDDATLNPARAAERPPTYAIVIASRLWILGQIRDRAQSPEEKKIAEDKIAALTAIARYQTAKYSVP